jgi:hypothetical protein
MLIEVWADTRRTGRCRSCGARIEWATAVSTGTAMPFDAPIVAESRRGLFVDERQVDAVDTLYSPSHFETCPQAPDWRRKGSR